MSNPENFKKYLGKEKYYPDFLRFFQQEMKKKGWQNVLQEYVFAGDARADDFLGRLYAGTVRYKLSEIIPTDSRKGFFHPLIHLGFGIEFNQPAIIAEALAQTALHDEWIVKYLLDAEKAAKPSSKTLPELLDEIRADEKLSTSAHWDDGNKVRDGILVRAPEEMIKYASQWTVPEEELEAKTVQMINAAIYFTACAQNPPKQVSSISPSPTTMEAATNIISR